MIIHLSKSTGQWRAAFSNIPDMVGCGATEREALGDLIFQVSEDEDADKATENIDVRIEITP